MLLDFKNLRDSYRELHPNELADQGRADPELDNIQRLKVLHGNKQFRQYLVFGVK